MASYGETDITPPEPLPLGGYTERSDKRMDGISQRLKARAVLLQQGELKIAIVSLETLTIPWSLTEEVKNKLTDKALQLILVATHTHNAPDSQMLNRRMNMKIPGIATFDPKWLDWYANKIAVLLQKEVRRPETIRIQVGITEVPLSRFRSFQSPTQQKPRNRVVSVKLTDNTHPIEILVYAAHPTTLDHQFNETHGDWPGIWMAQKPSRVLLQGALGDISPSPPEGKTGIQGAEAIANALNITKFPYKDHPSILYTAQSSKELPIPSPHPDFVRRYGIQEALAKLLIQSFAPTQASVSIIKLGELILVFLPAEPTEEVGLQIEAACKTKFPEATIVPISFANDWMGYILTEEQYKQGGYEATLSFYV
jgi:neutral ceramidase